jgi:hypothetical protein
MLEGVTLAQVVELVVKVLVNLAAGTVLDEKTAEDSKTAHPNNLAVYYQNLTPPLISLELRTLAYEHQPYPFSYQNHGVYQFFEQR